MRYLLPLVVLTAGLFACGGGTSTPDANGKSSTDTVAIKTDAATNDAMIDSSHGAVKADDEMGRGVIKGAPKAVLTYVPDGYVISDTCTGDLNKDAYNDMLVVLCVKDEYKLAQGVDMDSTPKRKLLLLTGNPDNTYRLAAQTDKAVYCITCGGMMGDPFMGLVIKNGFFSIEHYGGSRERWTRTTTFKYSPTDSTWLLHKDAHGSFDAVAEEHEVEKLKIYTTKDFGRMPLDSFDINKY